MAQIDRQTQYLINSYKTREGQYEEIIAEKDGEISVLEGRINKYETRITKLNDTIHQNEQEYLENLNDKISLGAVSNEELSDLIENINSPIGLISEYLELKEKYERAKETYFSNITSIFGVPQRKKKDFRDLKRKIAANVERYDSAEEYWYAIGTTDRELDEILEDLRTLQSKRKWLGKQKIIPTQQKVLTKMNCKIHDHKISKKELDTFKQWGKKETRITNSQEVVSNLTDKYHFTDDSLLHLSQMINEITEDQKLGNKFDKLKHLYEKHRELKNYELPTEGIQQLIERSTQLIDLTKSAINNSNKQGK